MNASLSILIPAAGSSSRLGEAKQLVEYTGKPLLQHIADTALSVFPSEVIIVTGADSDDIQSAVASRQIKWVLNKEWQKGLGGSIAAGAKAIHPASAGVMILLCDQWRIGQSDLLKIIDAWRSEKDAIVTASWRGQTMPPVIFPSDCFEQLQNLSGQKGAQSVLKEQAMRVRTVPMKNATFDLDQPEQLPGLKKKP